MASKVARSRKYEITGLTKSHMSSRIIRLPKYIFEPNLPDFVSRLCVTEDVSTVVLDFVSVTYYIPAAIVAIIAKIKWWENKGIAWSIVNFEKNPVSGYFQRIDFCAALGMNIPEPFTRHPTRDNFVPVKVVPEADGDVAPIATSLAACVDPERGESFRLLEFAGSEAILNARQHSGGKGFVSAQYSPTKDITHVGVADCGIGIRESFRRNASPHYKEGQTDLEALLLALKPEVSSTTHLPTMYGRSPNKGVGLSMMQQLTKLSLGYMTLISGRAWWYQEGNQLPQWGNIQSGGFFPGTICATAFRRDQIDDYFGMLKQARQGLGLQAPDEAANLFL